MYKIKLVTHLVWKINKYYKKCYIIPFYLSITATKSRQYTKWVALPNLQHE